MAWWNYSTLPLGMPGNCRMHIAKNGRSDFYHATVAVQSRNSTRNGVCYIFERDIWNSKSSQPISHSNDLWKLNRFYTHHFWQIIHLWNWTASILYPCFLCPFFSPIIMIWPLILLGNLFQLFRPFLLCFLWFYFSVISNIICSLFLFFTRN
jgi:hypothetical protein